MVLILSLISLVYMAVSVIGIVHSFAIADRKGRCKLLKNYKTGKFAAIFIAVFPLYLAAYFCKGGHFLEIILDSVGATVKVAALSFDFGALEPVAMQYPLFHVAIALCFVLAIINAFLFSASLVFRRVFNRKALKRIFNAKRDVCVLVGYGEKADSILKSIKKENDDIDVLVLNDNVTDDFKEKMYILRTAFMPFAESDSLSKVISSSVGSFDKRHCTVILLEKTEHENLRHAFEMAALSQELGDKLCTVCDKRTGLDTYLFSADARETVYRRIVRMSHGTVHCMNLYQMIANDFSLNYPITQMIPHRIDTAHASLKEGTDVRVIMIGFGKVNRQLFKIYTQTNQCMIMNADKPILNQLCYHIFDKARSYEDSSFNHTYLHYRSWKENLTDTSDYFELPEEPANVNFCEVDINNREFPQKLRQAMTTSPDGYNIVIVAMGSDVEALELSEKIAVNAKDGGCEGNTHIFVRVRDRALVEEVSGMFDVRPNITPFGDTESLFTYQRIVNPAIDSMAKDRHLCYSLEDKDSSQSENEALTQALRKWMFKWENIQRESNIYAMMCVRIRLQLLGYDFVLQSHSAPDASEQFIKDYSASNPIKYKDITVNSKRLVDYKSDYRHDGSPRSVLAEAEHNRWNAFYISNGFIPASKTEYKTLGKDELMRRRRHINITTFKGLDDFDTWRTPENGERPDVICYDYQIMDDVVWILGRNGYKIVRREDLTRA